MFLAKLAKMGWAMKQNARRHWLFTAVAIFWILSPFDDVLLPVIDELLIIAFWFWQAFSDRRNMQGAGKRLKSG